VIDHDQVRDLARRLGGQYDTQGYGHVDVLVNDIWGAEVLKGGPAQ
jgi:hypothetical protein